MFDSFLARFIYQSNPNNTPLVRTLRDNEVVYLMAFPAYRGAKKTLLSAHQLLDALRKTQASTLRDPALLSLLNITYCNIGLMPCKLVHTHEGYAIESPGGARYLNSRVTHPTIQTLAHNYNDAQLYTWSIIQRDDKNTFSEYPAYELEYMLYQILHHRTVFTTLIPFMLKGVSDLFALNRIQTNVFQSTLIQLHTNIINPMKHHH